MFSPPSVSGPRTLPASLILLLTIAPALLGQVTSGSISGYLFDPSQSPIRGAAIKAIDAQHAMERTVRSDSAGFYRFLDLPPAVYTVTAIADGFQTVSASELRVAVNSHLRVDLHPPVGSRGESVTVRADAYTLPTESSELGAVFDQRRIEDLPLNKRDFLQLALLAPGVLPPVQGSQISTRGNFSMHANGAREEFNNFLLDGVDNNDPDINRYTLQPPVDAIQEFKISTNAYSAEYGRSAGGQVNVITRGGSNHLHGFLYEYLRNRDLDARNFFDGSEKPKFIRNQFGGGVGGPIVRNRLFYFINADGLSARQGLSHLGTVPTQAERSGDLSALGEAIFDPFTGQPFPGNQIPPGNISPLAGRVLSLYPLPNRPGTAGNFLGQPVSTDAEAQMTARADYRAADADLFTLRYSFGRNDLFEPFAEAFTQIPGFGDYPRDRGHNAMIHEVHAFGPRTVNSLLAGFNRVERDVLPENYRTDVNKLWGVNYLPERALDFGYPSITVSGFPPVGDLISIPIVRTGNTYQMTDELSMVHGRQTIKLGAELRKIEHNGALDIYARGQMIFTGALSGSGLSDLLLGLPTVGIQSQFNNQQTLRTFAGNFFAQDDWKLSPNLTLNLGLRYEYNTPPTDPTNRMSTLDLATRQVYQLGTHGLSRSGIRPDWNNLAPRLGFAWSPASDLVVRGGYGIFYDSGMFNVNSALYFNPPFFTIRVFTPSQTSLLTLDNPFPLNSGFAPPPSLSVLSPDLTTGYLQDWNFNIQREFHSFGTVSLAYAGSKGTHLIRSRNLNQPRPGPGDLPSRAPFADFSNIFFSESGGDSEFHSLQSTFNRPLGRGLSVWAVYMLAKSTDDTSAFLGNQADRNFPQDSLNYHAEHAVSSFDIRQRATVACVYQWPARHLWTRDTETRAIFTVQGGQPFTPTLSFDNSNTGNTGGTFGSDRPDVIGDPALPHPTPDEWFNTAAFRIPAPYSFGSAGRNILRGPGYASFDVSLLRRISLSEWGTLSFEAQAFNLLNRTNFDLPQAVADQIGSFGRIFSAKAPRQIQFALRFSF